MTWPDVQFSMRLAGHLKMTLEELGTRMSAQEYRIWQRGYPQDPWGGERLDYLFAQLCCLVASVIPNKGGRKPELADYILKWGVATNPTPAQLDRKMHGMFAAMEAAGIGRIVKGLDNNGSVSDQQDGGHTEPEQQEV